MLETFFMCSAMWVHFMFFFPEDTRGCVVKMQCLNWLLLLAMPMMNLDPVTYQTIFRDYTFLWFSFVLLYLCKISGLWGWSLGYYFFIHVSISAIIAKEDYQECVEQNLIYVVMNWYTLSCSIIPFIQNYTDDKCS